MHHMLVISSPLNILAFLFSVHISQIPNLKSHMILLHTERPKLHRVLAILSAIGLIFRKFGVYRNFASLSFLDETTRSSAC